MKFFKPRMNTNVKNRGFNAKTRRCGGAKKDDPERISSISPGFGSVQIGWSSWNILRAGLVAFGRKLH
jgi:hypothetical protein